MWDKQNIFHVCVPLAHAALSIQSETITCTLVLTIILLLKSYGTEDIFKTVKGFFCGVLYIGYLADGKKLIYFWSCFG